MSKNICLWWHHPTLLGAVTKIANLATRQSYFGDFTLDVPRGCCSMWLFLVRQQGRLDSLCWVRLVNDVSDSVYVNLRDPPLVISFSFCWFWWWSWCIQCQTCDCRWRMGGQGEFGPGVYGVWRVRRVHVKLQTMRSIFNLSLCVCVCSCRKWQVSQRRPCCM